MENDKTVQEREAAQIKKEQRFFNTLNKVLGRFRKTKNNILDTTESTNKNGNDEKNKTAFDILFNKKGWYDQDTMKKSIGYNTTREILKFLSCGKLFKQEKTSQEKTIGSSVSQELTNENNSALEKQGKVFTEIAANTLQTNVILNDLKKISDEQKELTASSNTGILSSIAGLGGAIALGVGDKLAPLFKPITYALEKLTNILKSPFGFGKSKLDDVNTKKTSTSKNITTNKTIDSKKPSIIERAKFAVSEKVDNAKSLLSEKTNNIKQSASEAIDTFKTKTDDAKNAINKTVSGANDKLHSIAKEGADFIKKEGGELLNKGKSVTKKIPLIGAGVSAVFETTEAMENISKVDALVNANLLTKEEADNYKSYLLKKQAIRGSAGVVGGIVGGVSGAGVASVATGVAGSMAGEAVGEYLSDTLYGDDIKYYEDLVKQRRKQAEQLKSDDSTVASKAYDKLYEQQKKIDELKTLHEVRLENFINEYKSNYGGVPTDYEIEKWKRQSDKEGLTDYQNYSRNLSHAEMRLGLIEQETGYKLAKNKTQGVIKGTIVAPGKVEFNESDSPIMPSPNIYSNNVIPVQKTNNEQAHKEEIEYHYNKEKKQSQNNVAVQNNNTVNNTTIQNSPMITRNNDPSFRQNYNIGVFSDY